MIDADTDIRFLLWKDKTSYNPLKPHYDDISEADGECISDDKIIINLNESNMSEELKIVLKAWDAINNRPKEFNPRLGPRKMIEKWIENNYPEKNNININPTARERIAKVVNMDKKGGAAPLE
jgi:hypothetical protein